MIGTREEREIKFLDRLTKLNKKDKDGKYCWVYLASLTFDYKPGDDREHFKGKARKGNQCRDDSIKEGSCWCNKFMAIRIFVLKSIE